MIDPLPRASATDAFSADDSTTSNISSASTTSSSTDRMLTTAVSTPAAKVSTPSAAS